MKNAGDGNLVRLDRYLANAYVGTRNEVKRIIKEGRVSVNGHVMKDSAYHVNLNDKIELDGKEILPHRKVYILLHKPSCYVSTTSENEPSVLNLIEHPYLDELHIAGRLDKDVEGLLILTNDGDFTHKLISPKKHVEKEYYIYTDVPVIVTEKMQQMVLEGIEIEKGLKTLPGKITQIEEKVISITIVEGKYHQIKKMCKHLGIWWKKIVRVRIGNLQLGELKVGQWRELTEEEIKCAIFGKNEIV
ncbi:MAG: pseudouridine synthase [Fervidobacterium sp.]|jgi:16S rRNA pseudouridine516 synthase